MTWTRRRALRALGFSALGPALAPLVQACSFGTARKVTAVAPALRPTAEVRAQLREVVGELSQRFARASALAVICRRGGAMADPGESHASQAVDAGLILSVSTGQRTFEEATSSLGHDAIAGAAKALRARAAASYRDSRPPASLAAPDNHTSPVAEHPFSVDPAQWIERVAALYERARHLGGSRIVYRSAYVVVDDSETLFVGAGHDRLQRIVRTRAGVVFVAQEIAIKGALARGSSRTGTAVAAVPAIEVAEQSGAMGLEALALPRAQLDLAASRALSITSPLLPPSGEMDVVLEPSVAALLVERCIAPALDAQRWIFGESCAASLAGKVIGAPAITLIDDATLGGAYGSYFFDDEGTLARSTTLIERGTLRSPFSDRRSAAVASAGHTANARLSTLCGPIAPQPSNLVLVPGSASKDALVGEVKRGLLLEGGLAARADLRTWRFLLRAARAREIIDGKPSGVLYGAVDVVGDIPGLLAATRGLSSVHERACTSTRTAGSVTSPYLLTRARVCPAGS